MVIFYLYWIWVIFGIISGILFKLMFKEYDESSIGISGWVILLYLVLNFIPLLNWCTGITVMIIGFHDYYTKDWVKNSWIVKALIKKY